MIGLLKFAVAVVVLVVTVRLDGYVDQARVAGMQGLLLDVAPNLISSFLLPAAYLCWRGISLDTLKDATGISIGLVLYECIQLVIESGVFDVNDLVASITATTLYAAWYWYLKMKVMRELVASETE